MFLTFCLSFGEIVQLGVIYLGYIY
jgi:hypothetical protein